MINLCLVNNKDIVISAGDSTKVIKELMKIINEIKAIPEISYDSTKDCTKLEFEGYYNNFSLWLK
jgi:hypothetical protein